MTVKEAIERSGASYPSETGNERHFAWLSELEARIGLELFGKKAEAVSEPDTVLCAPDAYAEIYPIYLMMKRELFCGDTERYKFYLSEFSRAYSRYTAFVTRSYAPVSSVLIKML